MAKQVLKLDRRLGEIFMRESFKSFTILKLREAYVKDLENRDQLDLVEVRRYLYKQILRLKKRGLLRGRAGSNGRTAQYLLEDSFGSSPLRLVSGPFEVRVQPPTQSLLPARAVAMTPGEVEELREQAKQYQIEFMASVGEADEYLRLCKAYPKLTVNLEPHYLRTRERSSKLLGQVKAIEFAISESVRQCP